MLKIYASIAFCFILFSGFSQTKQHGILPFTGLRYVENGISSKKIEVELEESKWISNKLPVKSTFEVKLVEPIGFSLDSAANYHPNIRLSILNEAGDTVGHTDTFIGDGVLFPSFNFNNLSLSLAFKDGTPLGKYTIFASFYDELVPASLDIQLDVELVDEPHSNFTTNWHSSFTSYTGYHVETISTELSGITCSRDTIAYNNTVAVNMKIFEIKLPSQDLKKGTSSLIIYDANLNVIPLESLKYPPSIELDHVQTANYNPNSYLSVIIVFPMSENIEHYLYRWQWESADKKEKIDFIGQIK